MNTLEATGETRDERRRRLARESASRWRIENPERYRETQKRYREREADHKRARARDWRIQNYERAQDNKRRSKFGMQPGEYARRLAEQGGVCAICHLPERANDYRVVGGKRGLAVDHDHATGAVRGLLCSNCNLQLGKIEKIGLANFALYLKDPTP